MFTISLPTFFPTAADIFFEVVGKVFTGEFAALALCAAAISSLYFGH